MKDNAQNTQLPVQKDNCERNSHADGMDAIAGNEVKNMPGMDGLASNQACKTLEKSVKCDQGIGGR
ncbi:MAG TPA: hypothetical protein VKZ94_10855 [Advenella sp.]|nr:hypothetical protein [Advenella sp.]